VSKPDLEAAVRELRTPETVRSRAKMVLAAAEHGTSGHFAVDRNRLDEAVGLVVEVTRDACPDLVIPLHSRWRHLAPDGRDRWAALAHQLGHLDRVERARIRIDHVVPSVLLDAGAGNRWRYEEPSTGAVFARSEGLALASLELFERGVLSSHASRPLRTDGAALRALDVPTLAEVFQVSPDNPLTGLEGRADLLNRLGAVIELDPGRFGRPARVGHLFDHLATLAEEGRLPARTILIDLLEALAPIWPGRISLGGHNLGDVGRHPSVRTNDPTDGLVPFHKLSQWLAYSLIEPIEEAGIEITGLDALTGLAEYRNGGLLIDTGVLVPKHPEVLAKPHPAEGEVVVEWRALTVALLDEVALRVRELLGLDAHRLPLVKVLEGGTWRAGRRIAREKRADGGPPIRTQSDGTLF
jgi:hypothetical protein